MTYQGIEPDRGYMGDRTRGASPGRMNRDAESTLRRCRADIADLERRVREWGKPESAYLFTGSRTQVDAIAAAEFALAQLRRRLPALEAAAADETPRFYLRRVRLDSGGYDSGGAYWGIGGTLFHYESESGQDSGFVRIDRAAIRAAFEARGGVPIGQPGHDEFARRFPYWSQVAAREAAKDAVREMFPAARFWR